MEIDKLKVAIVSGVLVIGVLVGASIGLIKKQPANEKQEQSLGYGGQGGLNTIDFVSTTVTSTLGNNAQIILARNARRTYALIVNDSTSTIYIYPRNFNNFQQASTTVVINTGIRLNASGGAYEMLPENLILSDVWVASTTSANQRILVTER